MAIPIVALYGSINAILSVTFAANVTRVRAKTQVFLGSGDSPELARAVRIHGNNAEYVPLAIVTLLMAELSGGGSMLLHVLGGSLTLGRLLHAHGVGPAPKPTRALGAVITWLCIVAAAAYTLVLRMH